MSSYQPAGPRSLAREPALLANEEDEGASGSAPAVLDVRAYDELGVEEIVLFDPFEGRDRVAFQVFRRSSSADRTLVRELATSGDRVRFEVLDARLLRQGEGSAR